MVLAEVLSNSGYFADAKDAAKAAVKILAGREIGIGPVTAMFEIDIIEGSPSYSANLQAALVKNSRRYDWKLVELTHERCEIRFFQDGEPLVPTSVFTLDDAKTAGLMRPGSNWFKYPRNMLFARAMTNGVAWHCPDVASGMRLYDPDELGQATELPAEGIPPTGGGATDTPAHPGDPRSPQQDGSSAGAASSETIAAGTPAPAPDSATARWKRLFVDNDCPKPTPTQRERVKAVLQSLGVELEQLTDYPTFARAFIAARAQLGREVGAYTRASATEAASFTTPVPSEESGTYTVTLWQRGRHECTCRAGQTKNECKHLPLALGYLSAFADENPYARRDFALVLALDEPVSEEQAAAELAELAGE
jgi:hypothetical protein